MIPKKLSVNIVYNVLNQIVLFAIPLVTTPYIARVLSPELIGDYSFTLANSSYFVLLECLGFSLYGQIKVASVRDDREKLSCLFWEITFLKCILLAVCMAVFLCVMVPLGSDVQRKLHLIMALNILANGIDMTWLLNGLEEFKVTALRSMLVRMINVPLIFLFVKSENDIYAYAFIMQFRTLAEYCAVFPYIRKNIDSPDFGKISLRRHIRPSIVFFIPGIVNTVFSSADKTMLGAITGDSYEVGVYEQANKICDLCMSMISAVSNVILPRATYLYQNGKAGGEAKKLLNMSLRAAMMGAIPITLGIAAIADNFVLLFFGEGYEKSGTLLKILCFNVLFVSLSNFCSHQCLIARGKQKEYNIAICVSGLINVCLDAFLTARYASIGVSAVSVVARMIGLVLIIWFGRESVGAAKIVKMSGKYILAAMLMYVSVFGISLMNDVLLSLILQISVGLVVYGGTLLILRDDMVIALISGIKMAVHRKQSK